MSPAIEAEVLRLGAAFAAPDDESAFIAKVGFYDVARSEHWRGADPRKELVTVSRTIREFDAIRWPPCSLWFPHYIDEGSSSEISMAGGLDENLDVDGDQGRLLLFQIAWQDIGKRYFCLNLLDGSDDPMVWKHACDSYDYDEVFHVASLSAFLKRISLTER